MYGPRADENELRVNISLPAVMDGLRRSMFWRNAGRADALSNPENDEQPLRAVLYSVEQLAQHAQTIAANDRLAFKATGDRLIPRLHENERILVQTYELVTAAVTQNRRVTPAAEWLLDNFYLIEEQIRTARRHFPQSYSRELPRLANGPAAGYPRVYGIALDLISHVDGRVDAVSLNGFIASYQTVTPLKLGELWAVPIMLRLALIENLRRVMASRRHAAGSRSGERLGRTDGAGGRAESRRPDSGDGGHGTRESAALGRVPGGDDPASSGAESLFRLRQ